MSPRNPIQSLWVALWRRAFRVGLSAKMATMVVCGILSLLGLFAYLGTTALAENIQRTLQERVILAQTTAHHIDYILANIEHVLTETAAQPGWQTQPFDADHLAVVFQRLDFYATRVFLLDPSGQSIAAYPPIDASISFGQFASVQAVLGGRAFATSRYLRSLNGYDASTLAAVPIRNSEGQINGALVVSIDLISPSIRAFSNPAGLGDTGYVDVIDLGGTILASTRNERIGTQSDHEQSLGTLIREHRETVSACHDCHTVPATVAPIREVLAFAPLERVQWGVTVRQSEDEVFGSIRQLQARIFTLMVIMLAGALILVYLTTRSVIMPVQALTNATQRVAKGDLDTPLGIRGQDEIGMLAQSFDAMRERLQQSIAEIQSWNRELDKRVQERTATCEQAMDKITLLYEELYHKEKIRSGLLNRVLAVQEEERKRIARELHDETCQVLTGLAYALDDVAEITTEPEIKPQLERMHALANTALEEIHRIILDLRPTMLDHLGLIPALHWYAESRLSAMQIQFVVREVGVSRRLSATTETALFRIVQETINNIARHSGAARAEIVFHFMREHLQVTVADDGRGFNVDQVFTQATGLDGLGLLGIQERLDAIGGRLILRSAPGAGTLIQLNIPYAAPKASPGMKEHEDVKDNSGVVGG